MKTEHENCRPGDESDNSPAWFLTLLDIVKWLAVGILFFCLVVAQSKAASYTVSNHRTEAVVMRWQPQQAESPNAYRNTRSIVVPARSTVGPFYHEPFWYGFQGLDISKPAADGAYPRTVSIGAFWGNVGPSGLWDGHLVVNVYSDAFVDVISDPTALVAGAVASAPISDDEALDMFSQGFWLAVSLALMATIYGVVRSMNTQNHNPS